MSKAPTRQSQLAAIHIAEKRLGLSRDEAAALKQTVTGQASSADMNTRQRARYLAHLSGLQGAYGHAVPQQAARPRPQRAALLRSVDDVGDDRWMKARALWNALALAGQVRVNTDEALMGYVRRQTHMEHWRFLNGAQINAVVESLKFWCARTGAH